MSKETRKWLSENTLIGYTAKRDNAWHWREGDNNHYEGPVPLADVQTRLFNWTAEPSPIYVEDGDGFAPVPNKTAWKRSDNGHVMGIFSDGYQGHDYSEWLLTNVASILDTDELAIGSAGLLKNGAVAWVQIEMEDTVKTEQGFDFRPFLLATTSFDGSVATQYGRKVQAVVCDNTLSAAMDQKGQQYKLKHTKNSGMKMTEARDALNIIYAAADDFSAEIKRLTETSVSDKQWSDFLTAHVPMPEAAGRGMTMAETKREKLTTMWNSDERVSPWRGTALGVLQAVNTFNTHEAGVNKVERADRIMQNVISGKLAEADSNAMDSLVKILANV